MYKPCSKRGYSVIAIMIVATLILCLTCPASASTAPSDSTLLSLGVGHASSGNGDIDYYVQGMIYHRANNATLIEIPAMAMWIQNYGDFDVNAIHFEAHNGDYTNHTPINWNIDPIPAYTDRRIEADWDSICYARGNTHTYLKNGTASLAYTRMSAGFSYGGLAGWTTFWYANSRDNNFYY